MKKKPYPEVMKKHAAKELKTFRNLESEEKKLQSKMGAPKKIAPKKKIKY